MAAQFKFRTLPRPHRHVAPSPSRSRPAGLGISSHSIHPRCRSGIACMARSALHERECCISECSHLPPLCEPTGWTPDPRGSRLEIVLLIICLASLFPAAYPLSGRRALKIERAWRGMAPSHVKVISACGSSVHRIQVDEENGLLITTSRTGGMLVTDINDNNVLWGLPPVSTYALYLPNLTVVRVLSRASLIASMTVVTSSLTDSATARRCGAVSSTWKTVSIVHCPLPIRECCRPGPRSLHNGPPHLAAVTSGRGPFYACHRPQPHFDSRTQRYSLPARTPHIYGMCQRVVW